MVVPSCWRLPQRHAKPYCSSQDSRSHKRMVTTPIRVAHVSFHADGERRNGAALLEAWPTLSCVATAVSGAGVDVVVIQTAHADETIERHGVVYHFVNDARRIPSRLIGRVRAESPRVVHVHGFHSPL